MPAVEKVQLGAWQIAQISAGALCREDRVVLAPNDQRRWPCDRSGLSWFRPELGIRVGAVRRTVCASPDYLTRRAPLSEPADLAGHSVIGLAETREENSWSFAGGRRVRLRPRLCVNSVAAARRSAIEGHGVARLLSYQVADQVRAGQLQVLLEPFEPPPLPIHLVMPRDRLSLPKTRRFVDFAAPLLKAAFANA